MENFTHRFTVGDDEAASALGLGQLEAPFLVSGRPARRPGQRKRTNGVDLDFAADQIRIEQPADDEGIGLGREALHVDLDRTENRVHSSAVEQ